MAEQTIVLDAPVYSAKHSDVKPARLESVDILRGIVMVLMALDHVRDFFSDVRYNPLDLSHTDGFLFMTRWVTHFCAPVFVFLAGTGAFLSLSRGKTKKELSIFLITRGLWLIILELTLIRFCWVFNLDYSFSIFQVIWVIGFSMIVLSLLIHLPVKYIAAFGISLILFHNLFDGIAPGNGIAGWPWIILHSGGSITPFPGWNIFVLYPLIPWIGVMAAGYAFGSIIKTDQERRKKIFIRLGSAMILFFILIRTINFYGDPGRWTFQDDFGKTILSFINLEKYPPSLLYLLITLGPAIISLVFLEKLKGFLRKFFITFGRVPLFYYVLHIPLVHLLAILVAIIAGISPSFLFSNQMPGSWPLAWGFSLPVVYALWILVVLALYPISLWFANLKQRRKEKWLSYF